MRSGKDMKYVFAFLAALGPVACGQGLANDPIYQALLANPPTEIPAQHLPLLRQGRASCDVFEEGTALQYMTCWWPSGIPVSSVTLTYYGPNPLNPPRPDKIAVPGSQTITAFAI